MAQQSGVNKGLALRMSIINGHRKTPEYIKYTKSTVQRWGDIQEEVYRARGEAKELTGGRWVKTVLREIFNFVAVLWQRRNGRGKKSKRPTERSSLKREIRKLQSQNFYVPPKLRRLFSTPYDKLTASERPNSKLRRWVRIFSHCKKMEKHLKKIRPAYTSDITQFLNLPPPTEATGSDFSEVSARTNEVTHIHSKRSRQQFERQTVISTYLRTQKKPRHYVV